MRVRKVCGCLAILLATNVAIGASAAAPSGGERQPSVKVKVELHDIDGKIELLAASVDRVAQAIASLENVTAEERKEYLSVLEESLDSLTSAISKLKLSPEEQKQLIETLESASSIVSETLVELKPVLETLPESIAKSRMPVRAYLADARSQFVEPLFERTEIRVSAWLSKIYLVGALLFLALLLIVVLFSFTLYNSIGTVGRSIEQVAKTIGETFEQHKLVPASASVSVHGVGAEGNIDQ